MNWHEHGSGFRGRGGREEEGEERGAAGAGLVAVDAASAGRVAGRTSMSHQPTTHRRGLRAGSPASGSARSTSSVDREEITVVGTLADDLAEPGAAAEGRISRFRADTRAARIEIAEEARRATGARSPGVRSWVTPARSSPTSPYR
jgi:hypothetical protein